MKSSINVFPVRLTIFSLVFLLLILSLGLYSQIRTSHLLNSFQSNDIPTLQLSCAATRVMSETEQLLSETNVSRENVSIRALVLGDSLNELLLLTKEFPEVPAAFSNSASYISFQKYLNDGMKMDNHVGLLSGLKGEVQTLLGNYLFKKNEVIKDQIFFGYLTISISLIGVISFLFLIYAIYRRYQINIENLQHVTQNLEQERLFSIQSSRLASLGEMAAGLAHEINNPLAVIIGRAEIITLQINNGEATDVEISKTIGKINEMAKRISKIITSMRKISKGTNKDILTPLNLSSVIDDVMNLSSERLRNLSTTFDQSGLDEQLSVNASFSHLSQILINLMNNSLDELQKLPDDKRHISISTEVTQYKVLLKVKDSGPGIPPEVRAKLFQPFFTTKEIGKGTGLGLSISKNLMLEMGGNLELSPNLNETCFILSFKKLDPS